MVQHVWLCSAFPRLPLDAILKIARERVQGINEREKTYVISSAAEIATVQTASDTFRSTYRNRIN